MGMGVREETGYRQFEKVVGRGRDKCVIGEWLWLGEKWGMKDWREG